VLDSTSSKLHVALLLTARSPGLGTLSASVSGSTDIILVGDESQRLTSGPHFAPGVKVFIGEGEADVLAISRDSRFLRIRTPSFEASCGATGRQCIGPAAYRSIRVVNPPSCRMDAIDQLPVWTDQRLRYKWPSNAVPCRPAEDVSRNTNNADVLVSLNSTGTECDS